MRWRNAYVALAILAATAVLWSQSPAPPGTPYVHAVLVEQDEPPEQSETPCTDAHNAGLATYVRQGAGGNGSSWSNALSALPSSLTRGRTYCIADGTYSGYTFDDDASGTTLISVVKATQADHGETATWQSEYGDGQAVFSGGVNFTRPYYLIDGAKRNEANWKESSAYGFRIPSFRASRLDGGHVGSTCSADDITIRYVYTGSTGTSYATHADEMAYLGGFGSGSTACERWTLSHVLSQNALVHIMCAGCEDLTVEYAWFYIGWGKETIRGQISAKGMTVRYSIFEDSCQKDPEDPTSGCTGEIALWTGSSGTMDDVEIYGNVFWKTTNESNSIGVVIVGENGWGSDGPVTNNSKVYNNTFAGFEQFVTSPRLVLLDGGSGNEARNNLAYDIVGSPSFNANATSNNTEVSTDPFVNYAAGDFRLDGATTAGTTLGSPYDTDLDGVTRGADGNWDLGAFEYVASGARLIPHAPAGMRDAREGWTLFPVFGVVPASIAHQYWPWVGVERVFHVPDKARHQRAGKRVIQEQDGRRDRQRIGGRVRAVDLHIPALSLTSEAREVTVRDGDQLSREFHTDDAVERELRGHQEHAAFPGADIHERGAVWAEWQRGDQVGECVGVCGFVAISEGEVVTRRDDVERARVDDAVGIDAVSGVEVARVVCGGSEAGDESVEGACQAVHTDGSYQASMGASQHGAKSLAQA